jgi:type IV pilus assembly protein PilY1
MAATTISAADDTEIFFGQVYGDTSSKANSPNILFLLDDSGSMRAQDTGQVGTRMERLQSAMDTLLTEMTDVNVGIMSMNGERGGGPVRYPVTPLDQTSCSDGEECDDILVYANIQSADDDTEETISTGVMQAGGNILSVRGQGTAVANQQLVGARFVDLDIPQGATITGAYLDMTARSTNNGAAQWTIRGDDTDSASPFGINNSDLSNRDSTTATVSFNPGRWAANEQYTSADLADVVQEIVDRDGWCGGNDLALIIEGTNARDIVSKEDANANAVNGLNTPAMALRVTYASGELAAGEGCQLATAIGKVTNQSSDGFEYASNGWVDSNNGIIALGQVGSNDLTAGLRFKFLGIPQGARVVDARLNFTTYNATTSNFRVNITGHDVDNTWSIGNTTRNLSQRARTNRSATWTFTDNVSASDRVTSVDIAPIVQEIVDRPGWSETNEMMMLLEQSGPAGDYVLFWAYDGAPARSATLHVTYESYRDKSSQTARDDLKGVIEQLVPSGFTPLLSQQYEAAQYFLGNEVTYGRRRGGASTFSGWRVSHPDSYTGGRLFTPSGCNVNDPFSDNCEFEEIFDGAGGDKPTYISPIEGSCQTHHIVILSDGAATDDDADDLIRPLIGASACDSDGDEAVDCSTDLQRWLFETDQDTRAAGSQNILTHTIAFNLSGGGKSHLEDLAAAGGGESHTAASADELVKAFSSIVTGALSVDTSFSAAAATVSQFNRLAHRNDVYLALFRPKSTPSWQGNVKRYTLDTYTDSDGNESTELLGADNLPAVDPETGFFQESARSLWEHIDTNGDVTTAPDGHTVPSGGVASRIGVDGIENRNMYTFIGDNDTDIPRGGVDLASGAHNFHENNAAITSELLGVLDPDLSATERAAYRQDLLKWARGVDIKDHDKDNDTAEPRRTMGDTLHTSPVLVNYSNGAVKDAESIIYVSTNDGVLHAFDSKNGNELWAFTPQELLGDHDIRFQNLASSPHPYGLDGGLSLWRDDPNNDLTVDSGESVFLYAGMRRGGNNYYAFDITNPEQPKLAWVINGPNNGEVDPEFGELGQSWSQPMHTQIMDGSEVRDVLVFGAGYDTNQDPDSARDANGNSVTMEHEPDSSGRGLFVVDAQTGENLWTVSGPDLGSGARADQRFAEMQYGMPANVRIVDIDFDGIMDQLYVADTGGQIWRFDVTGSIDDTLFSGGVIADISTTPESGHRRFYSTPDVALIQQRGESYLALSIGSGWRAHPLNDIIEDAQYVIRMPIVRGAPEGYGIADAGGNYRPITEDDLSWVNNPSPSATDAGLTHGWYLRLTDPGEKSLGTSVIFQNVLYFSTYVPEENVGACATALGSGYVYALTIADGKPAFDFDNDGSVETNWQSADEENSAASDMRYQLKQVGLPSSPVLYFPEGGNPELYVGTEKVPSNVTIGTSRTFWVDTGVTEHATASPK